MGKGQPTFNIQQQQQRFGAFLGCSLGEIGKFEKLLLALGRVGWTFGVLI
jgi:hypothetical protein